MASKKNSKEETPSVEERMESTQGDHNPQSGVPQVKVRTLIPHYDKWNGGVSRDEGETYSTPVDIAQRSESRGIVEYDSVPKAQEAARKATATVLDNKSAAPSENK